jgi:hypothetical protein
MATTFPRVKAGDVIRHDDWNQVLAAIEDLYSRITTPDPTAVAITGFAPPGPVSVGDPLTIQGRNFQFSIGSLRLFFDGVAVNAFNLGSSDTQLLINVPDIPNLPQQGRQVNVSVYNRTSNDQQQITVIPIPVPLSGIVTVSAQSFSGTPTAGGPPTTFPFVVTSGLSVPRALTLRPTVSVSAWQNLVQVLDATTSTPQVISGGQIKLSPNQSMSVLVSIAIPSTAGGTPFGVALDAIDALTGANFGSSGTKSYTVGKASQDDPNVQFGQISLVDFQPPGQSNVLSGNTITLLQGGSAIIRVVGTFKAATKYTVSIANQNATGWSAPTLNIPSDGQFDFSAAVPPPQNLQFTVQATSTAVSGGQVVLQAQTAGQTQFSTTLGLNLAVASSG